MTCYDKHDMFYHQIHNNNNNNNNNNDDDNNNRNKNTDCENARFKLNTINNYYSNEYDLINMRKMQIFSNYNNISIGNYSKLKVILTIFIYFLLANSISFAYSQETNYYYTDGDAIQVQQSEPNDHFESLINKNFFSVFSSEMSILNSVENQSLNGRSNDDNNNHNNKQNTIYASSPSSLSSDFEYDSSQIPIAKIRPALLDFKEQQIGVPKIETVFIKNTGKDLLKLESISGSTIHFYCSFFLDKVIPPDGNTSFDVYFLARELGNVESSLYINTNKGIIKYTVLGTGIENKFKLKPILNARIPLNSSFTSVIKLHNPSNDPIQIFEIYTSDDDLHLELPIHFNEFKTKNILNNNNEQISKKTVNSKKIESSESNKKLWNLEPYETKPIVILRYMGRNPNNHTAFLCIKANYLTNKKNNSIEHNDKNNNNLNEISFVIPIELEVAKNPGIFTPLEQIDFGTIAIKSSNNNFDLFVPSAISSSTIKNSINTSPFLNYINSTDNDCFEKIVDLYLTNNGPYSLYIKNISSLRQNPALSILFQKDILLPSNTLQLTKVAEIKFNPLKSKKSSHNYGKLIVKTNDTKISFQIGFNADLYQGSLEYNKEQTKFYASSKITDQDLDELTQSFDLFSSFQFPLVVYNIQLNEYSSKYFELFGFKSPLFLKNSGQDISGIKTIHKSAFKLKFNRKKFLTDLNKKKDNLKQTKKSFQSDDKFKTNSKLIVSTNLTNFEIPLFIYDGLLKFLTFDENTSDNFEQKLNDLMLEGILLNTEKRIKFQIVNNNPIDVIIDRYRIVEFEDYSSEIFELYLGLEFLYYEPIKNFYQTNPNKNSQSFRNFLDQTNAKSNIKIPAHCKMVVELVIKNSLNDKDSSGAQSSSSKKNVNKSNFFLSSNLFKYNLKISTKYETQNFKIEFKIVNGSIQLAKKDTTHLPVISFFTFPGQISKFPVYIKSTFLKNLLINSIEFSQFGNIFKFNWCPLLNKQEKTKKNKKDSIEDDSQESIEYTNHQIDQLKYGIIKSNATTFLGDLFFDSKILCLNNCYLGIEPRKESSIVDISSVSISNLDDLDILDRSYIYDLWLKSFQIKKLSYLSNKNVYYDAIDLDNKLLKLFKKVWYDLNRNDNLFQTEIKLIIENNHKTTESKSKLSIDKNNNETFLTYSYPIKFKFRWPRFIKNVEKIHFSFTQIHVGYKTKNLTLENPSNSSVLMQIMLLDNYASKNKFEKFLDENSDFFSTEKKLDEKSNLNTEKSNQIFSISLSTKNSNSHHQRISKTLHDLNVFSEKKSLVVLLEPLEKTYLQIKFSPNTIGDYESFLIIRNNLTIIDSYYLSAEAGTAEVRIDDLAPMKTSIFFNGNQESYHKTIDQSLLLLEMSDSDNICNSSNRAASQIKGFDWNRPFFTILDYLNKLEEHEHEPLEDHINSFNEYAQEREIIDPINPYDTLDNVKDQFNWFETKEGIFLRKIFVIKNIGNTDLFVYHIMFDGEPCMSQGFEAAYCHPFRVSSDTNNTAFLDIRYQPDFTISFIRKRLTLVTNIGDLEYLIEIRIPHHMLSLCHDYLPRPPLEAYLIYLCFGLLSFLITIILISSFFESKSIIKFHVNIYKKISSLNEEKSINVQEFDTQQQNQRDTQYSQPNRLNTNRADDIVKTKSNGESNQNQLKALSSSASSNNNATNQQPATQPKSPKANTHRNLSKSSSSPKSNDHSSKKNSLTNGSIKKSKEKENNSFGFPPLVFETKSNDPPKNENKKDQKRGGNRSVTPPLASGNPEVLNEQNINLTIEKISSEKVKQNENQSSIKIKQQTNKSNPKTNTNPNTTTTTSINNTNSNSQKINKQNNKSGLSSSSNSSGTSTPSPPPSSISPVQFLNQKSNNINNSVSNNNTNNNHNNKKKQIQNFQHREQNGKQKFNKQAFFSLNLKSQSTNEQNFNQRNQTNQVEDSVAAYNSINQNNINHVNKNSANNLANNYDVFNLTNLNYSSLLNSENNMINNFIDYNNLATSNADLLNILNLLTTNNQQSNLNISDFNENIKHSEFLNGQLEQLQLHQEHLRQISYFNNLSPDTCLPNLTYNNDSMLLNEPELSNILFNSHQINQNNGEFSRSVSILSKRSSTSEFGSARSRSVSKSPSRLVEKYHRTYFRPIKNTDSDLETADDNDLENENEINNLDDGISFTLNQNSFNSTPTSDLWVLPRNVEINDSNDFEDTIIINHQDVDADYDDMVKETEQFRNCILEAQKSANKSTVKNNLEKAYSSPLNERSYSRQITKKYSHETSINQAKNEIDYLGPGRMLGPIERPNSISSNTNLNSNFALLSNNNYQNNLMNQISSQLLTANLLNTNQNIFNQPNNLNSFNEFKLFADEEKNANNTLDNLNITSSASLWPSTSTLNSSHSILSNKKSLNQAWNSVLLNDFDGYVPESPLLDDNAVDSSGNKIKSIWSNNIDEQNKK